MFHSKKPDAAVFTWQTQGALAASSDAVHGSDAVHASEATFASALAAGA